MMMSGLRGCHVVLIKVFHTILIEILYTIFWNDVVVMCNKLKCYTVSLTILVWYYIIGERELYWHSNAACVDLYCTLLLIARYMLRILCLFGRQGHKFLALTLGRVFLPCGWNKGCHIYFCNHFGICIVYLLNNEQSPDCDRCRFSLTVEHVRTLFCIR